MRDIIKDYQNDLMSLKESGYKTEGNLLNVFTSLVKNIAKIYSFQFIGEKTERVLNIYGDKNNIRYDGVIRKVNSLINFGYWEAKDEDDNLEEEIEKKISKGYSLNNTIFENTKKLVYYCDGKRILEIDDLLDRNNISKIEEVLKRFFTYNNKNVKAFELALSDFNKHIPVYSLKIKELIENIEDKDFIDKKNLILQNFPLFKNQDDVNELLVSHILTKSIFEKILFVENFNYLNELVKSISDIVIPITSRNLKVEKLYAKINNITQRLQIISPQIEDFFDKQELLKILYQNFQKSYNSKKADIHGIVYTPNEIVEYIIENTQYLLKTHFDKKLTDPDIKVIDPCVGTGTFLSSFINAAKDDKNSLEKLYKNNLYGVDIDIIPYYIALLNIEKTFFKHTGKNIEFCNLAFCDALSTYKLQDNKNDTQISIEEVESYKMLSEENANTINSIADSKFNIIIGNPPYNARALSSSDNNQNRRYEILDKAISQSFVKNSKAQNKTGLYDMYLRFLRWSIDKLEDEGIIGFVTNRSFIDKKSTDGIRKSLNDELDYLYIFDLGGDLRQRKQEKTVGNVFNIQTGVAIMFLIKVKQNKQKNARLKYYKIDDFLSAKDKLSFLKDNGLSKLENKLKELKLDKKYSWFDNFDKDYENFIPVCNKESKANKKISAIFKLYSNGINTAKDQWAYDFDKENLKNKMQYFIQKYEEKRYEFNALDKERKKFYKNRHNLNEFGRDFLGDDIKWGEDIAINNLAANRVIKFDENKIILSMYRPFVKEYLYYDTESSITARKGVMPKIFGKYNDKENVVICFINSGSNKKFTSLVSNNTLDAHFIGDSIALPLYSYSPNKQDNISDYSLDKFQKHYCNDSIRKIDIFSYVYAVFHYEPYLNTYRYELSQEFPNIPFYKDFNTFAKIGSSLIDIHLSYENLDVCEIKQRYSLDIISNDKTKSFKYDKDKNIVYLNKESCIKNIPSECKEYLLGGRCAIDWVVNEYSKKSSDKTLLKSIDKFSYKDDISIDISDLIFKVIDVSVKTLKLVRILKEIN